jgi:hypothetical protein
MDNKTNKHREQPVNCPSCHAVLKVARLACDHCGTAVEGDFPLPVLSCLDVEDQAFAVSFIQSSGSLKEMAQKYGVSYPTMRNKLDALIEKLKALESSKHSKEPEHD